MVRARSTLSIGLLAAGLQWAAATAGETPPDPNPIAPPETFSAEQRAHWAYQIPGRPPLPKVERAQWVRNPIDRFILAGLEEMGFVPAAEADSTALIRRVTFDLTGLPPTPEEVEAFPGDDQPGAFERLVDRLLASPAVRRTVGPALARPGALCRLERVRARCGAARRLAISRLGRRPR